MRSIAEFNLARTTATLCARCLITRIDLKFPPYVSEGARDFVTKLLRKEPSQRISLEECVEHPWILEHNAGAKK